MERRRGAVEDVVVDFWRGRNVFVSGATGLLGSWLVEALVQRGATVVCLLRDWVPSSRLIRSDTFSRVTVVVGELEDDRTLVRALNEYEIDSVFHLGAQAIVGTAVRSPVSTFESNIRGTWNILEACRVCPKLIERIVIASSDKAYGPQERLPYTEDMPLCGRSPYEVSKSCADLLAFSYFETYRLPLAVTRCGNLFGGGDLNFNRLIPGTIRSALSGEAPVIRSDGTYVRDYFYVRDAVEAYLLVGQHLTDNGVMGEAFNFGTETPLSVRDLVSLVLKLSDALHLVPTVLNQAEHEIQRQWLDCTKAASRLRWRPRFRLEDGLRETIDWYRRHLDSADAGVVDVTCGRV